MIKVNDTIILSGKNLGESCPLYSQWFDAFNLFDIYERELYGDILENYYNDHPDDTYTCIWIAPHFHYIDKMLYAIQSKTTNKIFLVDESVIGNNIHTYSSYNPCKEALKIMCANYRKVIYDESGLKERYSKLQKRLEALLNPMPALEDGMFGVIEADSFDCECKFRVMNGIIFIDNGVIFYVKDFKDTNKHCGLTITELYNDVEDFNDYENGTCIWSIFDEDNGAAVN